jgi:AcrR family transcriptional regulator
MIYGGYLRFTRVKKGWIGAVGDQSEKIARRPRADGLRNRERVLEAAKAVFSAGGPDASLEAVARAAGVGIGTLYRHFPTREALFEAVYRREVQQLADLAEQLKLEATPAEALRRWLRSNVEFVATKRGMSAALALAAHGSSELSAFSFDRLTRAVGDLLARAVAAGEIRADISAEDLLRALVGMCYMHDKPGWQASVLRLVDVLIDGLRRQPEGR